jgi:hypothetical protein
MLAAWLIAGFALCGSRRAPRDGAVDSRARESVTPGPDDEALKTPQIR